MTFDSNKRDPREGKIVFCEAAGCKEATVWNSPEWRKNWRLVWVDKKNISLSACSDKCTDRIKKGRYEILNHTIELEGAIENDGQIKLF